MTMSHAFQKGYKLILMSNGGSAADAQHIVDEFAGRFEIERKPSPALALHTNFVSAFCSYLSGGKARRMGELFHKNWEVKKTLASAISS